jgi:hypothetical protein
MPSQTYPPTLFKVNQQTGNIRRMRLRRLLATVVCAVLVCVQLCSATTVVVFVEPQRILIGADSLWSGAEGCQRCKINTQIPNCTYVIVGMRKDYVGLNTNLWAARSCAARVTEHLTLEETAKRFVELAKPVAEGTLQRHREPVSFSPEFLEVVSAAFEDGNPVVVTAAFLFNGSDELSDRLCVIHGSNFPFVFGVRKSAEQYLDSLDRQSPIAKDHRALIHKLIELEFVEGPAQVGPPISILEITKKSSQYLEQGLCDLKKKELAGCDDTCPGTCKQPTPKP